mmetsp:Transcript_60784/g.171962  ORF Transcript_60784/g.171962 Transcript_60784/m.171962 type:complete len:298 (+) Transcript_60784:3-896(+)
MHGLLSATICACPKLVLAVAAADGASNARPELWHAALGAAPRDQVVAAVLATRALHARDALLGLMRAAHGASPRLALVVATTNGACAAGPLVGHAALRAGPRHARARARALHACHTLHGLLQAAIGACPEVAVLRARLCTTSDALGTIRHTALRACPMHTGLAARTGHAVHALRRLLDATAVAGPEHPARARVFVSTGACPVCRNLTSLLRIVPRNVLLAAIRAKAPRAMHRLRAASCCPVAHGAVPLDPRREHRHAIAVFCSASLIVSAAQAGAHRCHSHTECKGQLHHGKCVRRL